MLGTWLHWDARGDIYILGSIYRLKNQFLASLGEYPVGWKECGSRHAYLNSMVYMKQLHFVEYVMWWVWSRSKGQGSLILSDRERRAERGVGGHYSTEITDFLINGLSPTTAKVSMGSLWSFSGICELQWLQWCNMCKYLSCMQVLCTWSNPVKVSMARNKCQQHKYTQKGSWSLLKGLPINSSTHNTGQVLLAWVVCNISCLFVFWLLGRLEETWLYI